MVASPGHLISNDEMPLVQQDLGLSLFGGFSIWALFGLKQENSSTSEQNLTFTFPFESSAPQEPSGAEDPTLPWPLSFVFGLDD